MKVNIGITDKPRAVITGILNKVLADAYVLYVKTLNYHWNVTGPNFSELHKLLNDQYEQLQDAIDEIAERTRALDGRAIGSMSEFLKASHLKEDYTSPAAPVMLSNLTADHESIIRRLREYIETCEKKGDIGTSDFLTGLLQNHEKMAWMLRAYTK